MKDIFINLAFEDSLSEAILRTVLLQSHRPYQVGRCFSKEGFGYLKNKIRGFNIIPPGLLEKLHQGQGSYT